MEEPVSQLRTIKLETPEDWIKNARAKWNPIKTYCLFSGGGDSSVVAHRLRPHYEELLFIDTGTAVPGVREFVEEFADWIDKPLKVVEAGDAFRRMVLGGTVQRDGNIEPGFGFPGKAHHFKAYSRLKERQIEAVVRETKQGHKRTDAVLFLSGVRRDESARRSNRQPLTEHGSAKFVNPLIEWTNVEMEEYKVLNNLPKSDVSALLHRSGECNCGAFQTDGEREMLESLWPEWWRSFIAPLEEEAEQAGLRWCKWGGFDLEGNQAAGSSGGGMLCGQCQVAGQMGLLDES
jgi:3'-phosphoadenosine 5'-phosphosulfate sulfotransferase (PAPS reductase)/FAD synthetase